MIGIIGAMEDEVALLRGAITEGKAENLGGFNFFSGSLEKQPVVLLRCGVGKVNAAVGCALLIQRYHPSLVINTGSAGGIDPALKFGDAVISDGLLYHDVDVTAFGYAPGQLPGQPAVFPVPGDLIQLAERAVDGLKGEGRLPAGFNHVRGLIGSGDVFMHDPERIVAVRRIFPALKAVEMEGAAIAHSCALFSVPALIIRALSDIAGTESPLAFKEFLPIASKHSAEIVRRIIRDYGEEPQVCLDRFR
ncbi:MAG: 5'-methylthioadenosine/S-adenosylhomocysteine nucleosidase [Treponema sp.]|jgi:adenosylhomocysteine nucleosidase|nr:5'-methylthioadenosine/S-adenosylhomocysteine nucleosidase [Treponema sp.]